MFEDSREKSFSFFPQITLLFAISNEIQRRISRRRKNPRIAGKFRLHSRQTENKAILHRLRGESERNQHRNVYHWLTADDNSYRGQAERATEAVRSSISSALSVALAESLSSLQRYIIRSPLNMVGFHCHGQCLRKKWYFFAITQRANRIPRDSKKRFKEETIRSLWLLEIALPTYVSIEIFV